MNRGTLTLRMVLGYLAIALPVILVPIFAAWVIEAHSADLCRDGVLALVLR